MTELAESAVLDVDQQVDNSSDSAADSPVLLTVKYITDKTPATLTEKEALEFSLTAESESQPEIFEHLLQWVRFVHALPDDLVERFKSDVYCRRAVSSQYFKKYNAELLGQFVTLADDLKSEICITGYVDAMYCMLIGASTSEVGELLQISPETLKSLADQYSDAVVTTF